MAYRHVPVLFEEVIEYLDPRPGENFIDCTLGGGGYTLEISKRILPEGKVLAIDLDCQAIENTKKNLACRQAGNKKNIILAHDNFGNLSKIVKECWQNKNTKFDGIVFDLGLSSAQLEDKCRGFSFQLDAPLNMAFGQETKNKKQETINIINQWSETELVKILKEYGEERFAKSIAKVIVSKRKRKEISTTKDLVGAIEEAVPASYINNRKIHFATRTFQALRIATNNELENLEKALEQSIGLLKKNGKLIVVSFHSLEDRIVKNFFKKESKDCVCPKNAPICQCEHKVKIKILTKKVITPSEKEKKQNPKSRSAKMRVAIKI